MLKCDGETKSVIEIQWKEIDQAYDQQNGSSVEHLNARGAVNLLGKTRVRLLHVEFEASA